MVRNIIIISILIITGLSTSQAYEYTFYGWADSADVLIIAVDTAWLIYECDCRGNTVVDTVADTTLFFHHGYGWQWTAPDSIDTCNCTYTWWFSSGTETFCWPGGDPDIGRFWMNAGGWVDSSMYVSKLEIMSENGMTQMKFKNLDTFLVHVDSFKANINELTKHTDLQTALDSIIKNGNIKWITSSGDTNTDPFDYITDTVAIDTAGLSTGIGTSTFDPTTDSVMIDTSGLSAADTSGLARTADSRFDYLDADISSRAIAGDAMTLTGATITSIQSGLATSLELTALQTAIINNGDTLWKTATGFSIFNPATDTVLYVRYVDTAYFNIYTAYVDDGNCLVEPNFIGWTTDQVEVYYNEQKMKTIEIYCNTDHTFNCVLYDENKNPVDITGWEVYLGVKENENDTVWVIDTTGVLTSPTLGQFDMTILHTQTDVSPMQYVYDMLFYEFSGADTLFHIYKKGDFVVKWSNRCSH